MVCPSGAKRAERMLPRRKVSCRYTGGGKGEAEKVSLPPYRPAARASNIPTAKIRRGTEGLPRSTATDAEEVRVADASAGLVSDTTAVRDESIDRFNRFRSARNSAAVWQRRSRSFSKALLIVSSSFTGSSGLSRVAVVGARLRIASVITAEVSPRNGYSGCHFVKHHPKREQIGSPVQFLPS